MDEMFGNMFHGDPMMALTDGRDGDRRQRHRDDRQPGRSRGSDVAPYVGQRDPFSFMTSMMSNVHNMMGNAFRQMVCTSIWAVKWMDVVSKQLTSFKASFEAFRQNPVIKILAGSLYSIHSAEYSSFLTSDYIFHMVLYLSPAVLRVN